MIKEDDVLLENLSDGDVQYILDRVGRRYKHIHSVLNKTNCVELVASTSKSTVREISFLYSSGRIVSIERRSS